MQIARRLQVAAAPDILWRIIAEDYADVGTWARAVHVSGPNTAVKPLEGAPVGGRICTASIGDVEETIVTFDPKDRVLAYTAQAKAMPFFVRRLQGVWGLKEGGGGTRVDLQFEATLMPPFELLMGWAMRRQFQTAIDNTLEDLKLFAETGQVHPKKAEALLAAEA